MSKLKESQKIEILMELVYDLYLEIGVAIEKCRKQHKRISEKSNLSKTTKYHRKEIFHIISDLYEKDKDLVNFLDPDFSLTTIGDAARLISSLALFLS